MCYCFLQETVFYEHLDFSVQFVVLCNYSWAQIQTSGFDQLDASSIIKQKAMTNLTQPGLQSLNILALSCQLDKEVTGKENRDGKEVRLFIKHLVYCA